MSGNDLSPETDARIVEIGTMIARDPKFADNDWTGIALVGDFANGQEAMHGFVYREGGKWNGALPKDDDEAIFDALLDLRDRMADEKQATWHQCLVQISRPKESVKILFEYETPDRWSVNPSILETKVDEMRPDGV